MTHKCCSPECAVQFAEKERQSAVKKAQIAQSKLDRQRKEKLKTRSDYIKEAKTAMHAYVRKRDEGKDCISCDTILSSAGVGGGMDAGHYRSVGSAKHLEFDERNIHGQCKRCNNYLSGNAVEYRKKLIQRFGPEFVEGLEADNTPRKLTIEDLKQIKETYKRKLKELG